MLFKKERERERESGKTNMFIYLCKDKQNQEKKITKSSIT